MTAKNLRWLSLHLIKNGRCGRDAKERTADPEMAHLMHTAHASFRAHTNRHMELSSN